MYFVDTHAHLYSEEFDKDFDKMMERAFAANVKKIIMPNVDVESISVMQSVENKYPTNCFSMYGLHPCYVKEDYKIQLDKIYKNLVSNKTVAVGEIGLDFHWDTTFRVQQFEALNTQLQWALDLKLPVAIHTRKAWKDTVSTIQPFAEKGLKGVFHCFGGSLENAQEVIGMGFKLGIGGVATYKKSELDHVLPFVSLKDIVLETDCPYLSPVPYRGQRNESSYIPLIANKLAEMFGTSVEKIAKTTTENAEKLFNI